MINRFASYLPATDERRAPWPLIVEAAADRVAVAALARNAVLTMLVTNPSGGLEVRSGGAGFAGRMSPADIECSRRPSSHVGMPNYVGLVQTPSVANQRRSTWFESLNERSHYVDMQLTLPVVSMVAQPVRIAWRLPSGVREHWPDALVEQQGAGRILVDVTRKAKLDDPQALAIFVVTAETAAAAGWEYQLRTEMPAQRSRNLRWLWSYYCEELPEGWDEATADLPTAPCTVADAAEHLGGGVVGRCRVWRLVATQRAWLDLDRPITLASEVQWVRPQPEGNSPWIATL